MPPSLNPALREFWRTPARNRVLYGGRASSKSWDAAGFGIFLAQSCKMRFLCARQFQNKIEESVYTLLKIQIERFGLQANFLVLDNKIVCRSTGSEFVFYGLWRSIDEIKSLEGIDVLWIEEAHALTQEQWDVLEGTIRRQGSQIWIIFNPKLVSDFVYRKFVTGTPADTVKRKINYDENPFLSDTLRKVIAGMKEQDYERYLHVYEGQPLQDDEAAVIRRTWLLAALDAHKALGIEPRGMRVLGFDVADAGEDQCAMVEAHGPLVGWSDAWRAREDDLLKSCTRVWTRARDVGSMIVYDAIGVGASAGAKFNELNTANARNVHHQKFFAGGAVMRPDAFYADTRIKNRDMFANIKAQAWWLTADRLRNTYAAVRDGQKFRDDEMIFIDAGTPNLDQMIDELATPKRDYDQAGRVKVESKKDLAKRDVPSPNLADAFIMTGADLVGASNLALLARLAP